MTHLEIIRTKIEQRREEIKAELDKPINPYVGLENLGRWKMCDELLSSISTLGEEWKPSEEQMKHLERCFSHGHTSQLPNQHVLKSLYNDLKKLM